MKALVKKQGRARGLWLEDVPEPEPGINDVLIRVKRTAICGTDVHIYKWDAWAQKTIPVPMVVGHEFVGEIVEVGDNVERLSPRPDRLGRGPYRLRPLPQLHGRAPPPLPLHAAASASTGRAPSPNISSIPAANVWHPCRRHRPRHRLDLRSLWQCHPHRLAMGSGRRGRAGHRRRPDRRDGGRDRAPCRRPPRRHHRRQRLPARPGEDSSARPAPSTSPRRRSPTSRRSSA